MAAQLTTQMESRKVHMDAISAVSVSVKEHSGSTRDHLEAHVKTQIEAQTKAQKEAHHKQMDAHKAEMAQIEAQGSAISSLSKEVSALNNEVLSLNTKLNTVNSNMSGLSSLSSLTALETGISALNTTLNERSHANHDAVAHLESKFEKDAAASAESLAKLHAVSIIELSSHLSLLKVGNNDIDSISKF